MDATDFARAIRRARTPDQRVAWFGALLAKATGRGVEVVGGSAIEVYLTSDSYVSQDIDLVGDRDAIENVLREWEFRQVEGRDHRKYWTDEFVGLVDLVGRSDNSGLAPRKLSTPHGPVLLSAPEPLLIRRLSRSKREGSAELFRQALELGRLGNLDWKYLQSEARFEGVETELEQLRAAARRRDRGARRSP